MTSNCKPNKGLTKAEVEADLMNMRRSRLTFKMLRWIGYNEGHQINSSNVAREDLSGRHHLVVMEGEGLPPQGKSIALVDPNTSEKPHNNHPDSMSHGERHLGRIRPTSASPLRCRKKKGKKKAMNEINPLYSRMNPTNSWISTLKKTRILEKGLISNN